MLRLYYNTLVHEKMLIDCQETDWTFPIEDVIPYSFVYIAKAQPCFSEDLDWIFEIEINGIARNPGAPSAQYISKY